ncbi:MAG TPA: gamma-glutamyltransferase [Xanthobacteraceae bacterium]|nr:gamma-glutamyltransferase [Xanthobacteraceae bacterium]
MRALRPAAALFLSLVLALPAVPVAAQGGPQLESPTIHDRIPPAVPVASKGGMVVAQEARAAEIGADILRRGGNAVDAAVAVGFAMAVTYPRAGNIGGGGFMTIHLAAPNIQTTIDYRETAPAAITRDSFLATDGEADPFKSRHSALAIGVPGTVAGLVMALERYGSGKFGLSDLVGPAIRLAREGFPLDGDLADSLPAMQERFSRWPSSAKVFLKPDGTSLQPGDLLAQPDLADTLTAIARFGTKGFYHGPVAERLIAAIRDAGGVMILDDLNNYQAIEREPLRGRYRDHDIIAMPPSSSGGVVLIEMLNILEGYDLARMDDAARLHVTIEAMKRAYADRAAFLGDPATVEAPLGRLTDKGYAKELRDGIDLKKTTPSDQLHAALAPPRQEGDNTTHFSIVDAAGNAVANTYTLNFSYGLGLVADGTGVLLNNELDDFAAKPGAPNAYGLVGGEANAPGPNKRPLSSMTPTIVLKDGKPVLVTGSPGGSRIITTVLQVIQNSIDRRLGIAAAVAAPRIHHQWLPDQVLAEPGFAPEVMRDLAARGHHVVIGPPATSANSVTVTPEGVVGAADPRTRGALAAGAE